MSIESVTEDYSVMSAEDHIDPDQIVFYAGSAKRKFQVIFSPGDAAIDRPFIALDNANIPQPWTSHPSYPFWYVSKRRAYFGNGPFEVFVDIDYEYIEDPLNQPPDIQFIFEKSTEPIDRDIQDNAMVNSSGEPFDPPLQKEFADLVIRIVRNEAFYDPTVKKQFIGATNLTNWTPICINKTFTAKTVKCTMVDGIPRRCGEIYYHEVTYEFKVRDDYDKTGTLIGWKRRVLDQGLRENDSGDLTPIKDSEGNAITTPVNLDGSGQQLANGADPVFLLFEVDKQKEFAALAL